MNVTRALFLVTAFATRAAAQAPSTPGVTYQDTRWRDLHFQVARVDLNRAELRMYWKNERGRAIGSVRGLETWLARNGQALLVGMNAGMFNACAPVPTGLFIARGQTPDSPLNTSPVPPPCEKRGNFYDLDNGVFYIARDGTAHIVNTSRAAGQIAAMAEATQSGPHLLDAGRPHRLVGRPGIPRNAIAVCSPTEVALVLAPDGVRIRELAEFISDKLHCPDALYLDGGPVPALLVPGRVSHNVNARAIAMIGVTARPAPRRSGANP
jgi:uncharacterized protein YigE (DUF2233 family)